MNIAAVIKFPLKGAGSEIQQKKGFFFSSLDANEREHVNSAAACDF
jgi:hypothetical protein